MMDDGFVLAGGLTSRVRICCDVLLWLLGGGGAVVGRTGPGAADICSGAARGEGEAREGPQAEPRATGRVTKTHTLSGRPYRAGQVAVRQSRAWSDGGGKRWWWGRYGVGGLGWRWASG